MLNQKILRVAYGNNRLQELFTEFFLIILKFPLLKRVVPNIFLFKSGGIKTRTGKAVAVMLKA